MTDGKAMGERVQEQESTTVVEGMTRLMTWESHTALGPGSWTMWRGFWQDREVCFIDSAEAYNWAEGPCVLFGRHPVLHPIRFGELEELKDKAEDLIPGLYRLASLL